MSERDRMQRGSDERVPFGVDRAEPPPEIKRPRGSTWRRLEAEGVAWEGQVFLVGEGADLAARLIVTKGRVAFVRGGAVVLEIGREWLKPPPLMLPDGTIALSVGLDGATPEDLFVQVREGRRVAGHLVTLLGGSGVRRVRSPEPTKPARAAAAAALRPPAFPGPLFPDEVGGTVRPPSSAAAFGGLPGRPDPAPSPPYEPSWARPPRQRAGAVGRTERSSAPSRAPAGERAERPERVTALAPAASPFDPPRSSSHDWAAFDALLARSAPSLTREPPDEPVELVPAPATPAGVARDHDWNLTPIRGMAPRAARRRRRQEWLARLLGLMILVVFASVAVTSRIPIDLPGSGGSRLAAPTVDPSPPAVAHSQPTASAPTAAEPPAPGTTVVDLAAQTAEVIGVGGPASSATVAPTVAPTAPAPTPAPTSGAPPPPASSSVPAGEAGAPNDEAAPAATATAIPTATAPPQPTATETAVVPTEIPTASPTATGAPTPAPTATDVPPAAPTAAGAPASETAAPDAAAAVPTQAPSLAVGEVPAQGFAGGPFRFAIVGAVRAPSVPSLGLYDYGTGEWVALFVDVVNWSAAPATLRMPEFTLEDASRTAPVLLDTGTGLIARSFGLKAAYVHDAQVPYGAGEQHRVLLLFLVHPDAADLRLRAGEAAIALDDMLAEAFDPADLPAAEPVAPDLLQATVTAVLDAETIEVDLAGVRQEVRYLGIDAPAGDACWATEAARANAGLVAGQMVWLERQRSNADRHGRLMRDVWVLGPDGTLDLVAARLVALGAAEPKSTVPNTRLSGWLAAAGADAATAGAGRWSACPETGGIGLGRGLAAVLPFLVGLVWLALGSPGLDTLTTRRHGSPRDAVTRSGEPSD